MGHLVTAPTPAASNAGAGTADDDAGPAAVHDDDAPEAASSDDDIDVEDVDDDLETKKSTSEEAETPTPPTASPAESKYFLS